MGYKRLHFWPFCNLFLIFCPKTHNFPSTNSATDTKFQPFFGLFLRVLKEMRNTVNRRVNCETANINKTVNAAAKQVEDILYIEEHKGLASLPDTLYEMARVRLENPDATLKALGEILVPPVGKSGVNHRLRKISEYADKLRDREPARLDELD